MAIKRNEYKGSIALGGRIKTSVVSSLDTVVETTQLMADTVATARSTMELIHGALQPAIAEQRVEYAEIVQNGIKKLVAGGMDEAEAKEYLIG